MAKDSQVHQRLPVPELADQKRDETDHQNCGGPADPYRAEPVIFLTLVENDLQAAQPQGQKAEADTVQLAGMSVFYVGRVLHVPRDHEHCEDADWNIDVKRPAPGIAVGEPSAERWTQHWSDHYSKREHGHCHTALLGRKGFEQDRLR